MFNILSGTRFMLGKTFITILLSVACLGLTQSTTANAQEGFSTSNERSLYDAQTRAMRQKARSQLETDTQKVRDIAQDNLTLDQISARVEECTALGKVYNGDPTDSGNPDIYCQSIVGSVPTEINFIGLAAWYDMNSSSGVELDENGRVAKLIDKAGGGFHLEQASASQRPSVITTDDYNAKANSGITLGRFDGNDALISPNNITANLGISGNYEASIFAVFAYDSTASGNDLSVFRMGSGSGTGSRLGFLNNGSNPKYTVHHNNMGYPSNWPTDLERLILMDYHKEKDSTNADLYINGTATTLTITGTPNVQDGPLRVGQWGDTGHHMKGDIAELIIYNRQLSEAQRASVQSYLMNKYGLQPFVNCPSQTVSTGQCTAATGTGNHADTRILSCTGTYGDCSNEQICRDGNWQEVSNSCPPPANCTTVSRSILGQCSANSGAVLHNATANLSCAGTYGTCTAKSTCFNGAMGATFDEACPAPNKCFALASGYSYNSGQGTYVTQATIPESAIGQTQTVEAMRDGTHLGQLTVRCEATGQFSVTNADVYRCPSTTVNNCDLTGSSTAGYGYHAQTSGTCSTGFSGACNYQCQRGSWSLGNNSCAQGCDEQSVFLSSGIFGCSTTVPALNNGQTVNVSCTGAYSGTVEGTATCVGSELKVKDGVCTIPTKTYSKDGYTCSSTTYIGTINAGQSVTRTCRDDVNGKALDVTVTCIDPEHTESIVVRNLAPCSASSIKLSQTSPSLSCYASVPAANSGTSMKAHCFASGTDGWGKAYNPTLTSTATCIDGTWSKTRPETYTCAPHSSIKLSNKCTPKRTGIAAVSEGGIGEFSCISGSTVYSQDMLCRQVNPNTMDYYYSATESNLIPQSSVRTRGAYSCARVNGTIRLAYIHNYTNLNLSASSHGIYRTDSSYTRTSSCGAAGSQTFTCSYGRFQCQDGTWVSIQETCNAGSCDSYTPGTPIF